MLCFDLLCIYSLVATLRWIRLTRIILKTTWAIIRESRGIPFRLISLCSLFLIGLGWRSLVRQFLIIVLRSVSYSTELRKLCFVVVGIRLLTSIVTDCYFILICIILLTICCQSLLSQSIRIQICWRKLVVIVNNLWLLILLASHLLVRWVVRPMTHGSDLVLLVSF